MKQYNRAKEKRMDLISVYDYTIDSDDGKRIHSCRQNKRSTVLHDSKDNGERGDQSGRSGSSNWGEAIQHQQSDAQKICGERGFSPEDGREHWSGCGTENAVQKIGDAA